MDIKQLQTFITLSELLNFRATAEKLNYSQSTVSDHIKNLEDEFNVKIFERLGRKVYLTDQGKNLIGPGQTILRNYEDIKQLYINSNEISGNLKIGAAESFCISWLPRVLKEYTSLYPKVDISLKMADCIDLPGLLENNSIDIAFGFNEESKKPYLIQKLLFEDTAVFLSAPSHSLARFKSLSLYELEDNTLILPEVKCGYGLELKNLLKIHKINPGNLMEFNSIEVIKQCVKNNLGITLLPKMVVTKEVENGELLILPMKTDTVTIKGWMTYHREKWISPAMKALIDLINVKK